MDSTTRHEVIARLNLWYRWQLSYSEKRIFLRKFTTFLTKGYGNSKVTGVPTLIKELALVDLEEQKFIIRKMAIVRMFRLFQHIDSVELAKLKNTRYNQNKEVLSRLDIFLTEFDQVFRDVLSSAQNTSEKKDFIKMKNNEAKEVDLESLLDPEFVY